MGSHDYAGNCFGYLWWSLVFGLSISALTCFYVPLFEDPRALKKDNHLDERALHMLSIILTLPSSVFTVIACWKMVKAEAESDKNRRSFVLYILVGVVVFALGTAANAFIQLAGEVQVRIKSAGSPLINCTVRSDRNSLGECNCVSYWNIVQRGAKLVFVVCQTIFLCLCAFKRLEARWWLQLLIANLLVIDIYIALWSLVYKYTSEESLSDGVPPLFPDFPGAPASLQDACNNLSKSASLYAIRNNAIKWLYSLQSEFFLCAAGLLLNFWFHVQKPNEAREELDQAHRHSFPAEYLTNSEHVQRQNRVKSKRLCGGAVICSILGACVGVCFFVMVLVLGQVELDDCKESGSRGGKANHNITVDISTRDAMVWHSSQWIVYRVITITSTAVILRDLFCFHKRRQGHVGVDTWVLGVFLPAVVVFQLTQLIASAYLQPTECSPRIHAQLTMTTSVMAVADALLQTGLVFCGSHFCSNHGIEMHQEDRDVEGTPLVGRRHKFCLARYLVTFLAICDLAVWLVRSAEAINKQIRSHSAPAVYFGKDVWHNIVVCLYPILALFYFHCFACLLELYLLLRPKSKTA